MNGYKIKNLTFLPCSSIHLIGMVFHAGKFELLRFWMNRDLAPNVLFMAPDGGPIEEKETLRDLGVQISTNLTFSAQIELLSQAVIWLDGFSAPSDNVAGTSYSSCCAPSSSQGLTTVANFGLPGTKPE